MQLRMAGRLLFTLHPTPRLHLPTGAVRGKIDGDGRQSKWDGSGLFVHWIVVSGLKKSLDLTMKMGGQIEVEFVHSAC